MTRVPPSKHFAIAGPRARELLSRGGEDSLAVPAGIGALIDGGCGVHV